MHRFLVCIALLSLTQNALADSARYLRSLFPTSTYIACHGENTHGEESWNWAEDSDGTYLLLNGVWAKFAEGEIFITDERLEGEVAKYCVQILEKLKGPEFRFSHFKARISGFLPESEIEFHLKNEKRLQLRQVISKVNFDLANSFLDRASRIMKSPDYSNILSHSIYQYYYQHPHLLPEIEHYLREAIRYEALQESVYAHLLKEVSETPAKLALGILNYLRDSSDYEILSYQFRTEQGVERGLFNSYVDLVTDAFKPTQEQLHLDTQKLFDASRVDHLWTYALIQAFSSFASLKNILMKIEKASHEKDSEEVLSILLPLYVKEASRCMADLYRLEQLTPVNYYPRIEILDDFRYELIRKRNAMWH